MSDLPPSTVEGVGPDVLKHFPLPRHRPGDDKEARGRVLVIAGSVEAPGAAMLAGLGALRAGAGKLQIATCESVAPHIAVAIPEARLFALPETRDGGIHPRAVDRLRPRISDCAAVVLGPGMMDEDAVEALTAAVLDLQECPPLVLDAGALKGLRRCRAALEARGGRTVMTPHAGEMAGCMGLPIDEVSADPLAAARKAAAELHGVVALKGGCTRIVAPDGGAWTCSHGNVGLATSGSGDTLAGFVGGLLARGADPVTATLWGVYLHGEAGDRLARRLGPLGFLARELVDEVPTALGELDGQPAPGDQERACD